MSEEEKPLPAMLYYPYINAPTPVLYQALLYWDELATVVPPAYEQVLSPQMRQVKDLGLYRPVEARRAFQYLGLNGLESELNHALHDLPLDDLLPPDSASADPRTTQIFTAKLPPNLVEDLVARGLARLDSKHRGRLRASPHLLMILLSITARRVASEINGSVGWTGRESLRPYTDVDVSFRAGHDPIQQGNATTCWQIEVGGLLPVPHGDVMMGDVLKFRAEYADERQRLMRALDELLSRLQQQYEHPADVLRAVQGELAAASADLNAAASASRLTWITRSIAVCVALGSTGVAHHVLPQLALPLGLVAGVATNIITERIRPERHGREGQGAEYSYLQRVNQALKPVNGIG